MAVKSGATLRGAAGAPKPVTKMSITASASDARSYLRSERTQLVAISSSAPNSILATSVGLGCATEPALLLAVGDDVADDARGSREVRSPKSAP